MKFLMDSQDTSAIDIPLMSRRGKRLVKFEEECSMFTPGHRWVGLEYCVVDVYGWIPVRLSDDKAEEWLSENMGAYATQQEINERGRRAKSI